MKKTYFIIGTLLLFLIVLSVVILSSKPAPLPQTVPPTPPPISLNPIPSAPVNTRFSFPQATPLPLPTQLPLYAITTPPQTLPLTLATQLGFTTQAFTMTTKTDTTHRWQEPNIGSLTLRETPVYLFFNKFMAIPSPSPNPEFSDSNVVQFLQSLNLAQTSYPLLKSSQEYFLSNGVNEIPSTQANANLILITYAYNLADYPFFISSKPLFSAKASITSSGELKDIALYPPPNLKNLGQQNLIPTTQATSQLISNQGILVSATTDYPTETTIDPNFSRANIKTVQVIYIQDLPNQLVRPMYQFNGTAPHSQNHSIEFDIVYLVNAT